MYGNDQYDYLDDDDDHSTDDYCDECADYYDPEYDDCPADHCYYSPDDIDY